MIDHYQVVSGHRSKKIQLTLSRLRTMVSSDLTILTNATSMIGTTLVTSFLGFAYWWLAAHQFSSATVGLASAMISAMTLLGTISMLGLGTLLIGELPRRPGQAGPLITTALMGAGTVGGVLGIAFALLSPWISSDFAVLNSNVLHTLLFALGVSFTAITLVLDQALIGLLRGGLQLGRNTLFAFVKLGALFLIGVVLSDASSLIIYATWFVGNLVSLVWIAALVFRSGHCQQLAWPQLALVRGVWRAAFGHHALNLTLQAPTLALPLVVTGLLSSTANAHFYVAWMLAGFVFVGPSSLTMVLYAVGAAHPAALASKIRMTLGLSLLTGAGAMVALLVGGDWLLHIFGGSYATGSTASLYILGFAVFPLIIKNHFIMIRRIKRQIVGTAIWTAFGGLFELSLAAIGASVGGLPGLCIAWVLAIIIEAIAMAYTVYRVTFPVASVASDK